MLHTLADRTQGIAGHSPLSPDSGLSQFSRRHAKTPIKPRMPWLGRKFTILAGFALVVGGHPLAASAAEDAGTRSVFAQGAGNRAVGMGGAFVGVADDASATMWNPAGL